MSRRVSGWLRPLAGLLLAWLWHAGVAAAPAPGFHDLLKEGGLEFTPPAGFRSLPVEPDYVLPYEARYRSPDGGLEVRYAIRPLDRIEIDYHDPHSAAPAPNDLFNMLFRALSETLAADHQVTSREYPAQKAQQEFRAGWAAVGVFDLAPGVSRKYHEGMLFAIHQNDKSDAYILFLTNDLAAEKGRIKALKNSLRFQRFEHPVNRPPTPEELQRLPGPHVSSKRSKNP